MCVCVGEGERRLSKYQSIVWPVEGVGNFCVVCVVELISFLSPKQKKI